MHQEHTTLFLSRLLDEWKNRRMQGAIRYPQQNKSPYGTGLHTKASAFHKGTEIKNWSILDFESPESNIDVIEFAQLQKLPSNTCLKSLVAVG